MSERVVVADDDEHVAGFDDVIGTGNADDGFLVEVVSGGTFADGDEVDVVLGPQVQLGQRLVVERGGGLEFDDRVTLS